tara:strand:+ start:578 stop:946 length:369 start_codon:yes stop_codon:yes gene_type:complete
MQVSILIKNSTGGDLMAPSDSGWNEYSRLVLEQLEALSVGIDSLRDEMQTIRQELAIMKAKEDRVTELKVWKEKIDEVASPTQLRSTLKDIEDLKIFKTKSIAIFMAVQTMMGLALAWSKMF